MKIVVVGAGTAGWVVASSFKKVLPHVEVVIIHDPEVKTMGGVGETLVWNMPRFFNEVLGLKDCREWMSKSQATFKTGVKFHNFGKLNQEQVSSYAPDLSTEFLYTNQTYDLWPEYMYNQNNFSDKGTLLEVWLKLYNEGKHKEIIGDSFVPLLSETHWFSEYETSPIDHNGEWLTNPLIGHSYHYNAEFVGRTIGELVGLPCGVIEKYGNVKSIEHKNGVIDKLILTSGEEITADLYVDCTGFKRRIVKELPFKWIACDEFTNNASLVRPMFYDGSKRRGRYLHGRTHFYAHSSGWSFEVPLLHRTGNGYSFCRNITPDIDKLADEFNNFIGPRNLDFDEPELRLITWDPGYYEQIMVGNCMTFGLSWGFIDPYASNNLMATTAMLERILSNPNLLDKLSKKQITIEEFRQDVNRDGKHRWEHINNRVQSIFRLTTRNDSEYWNVIRQSGIDKKTEQHVHDYFTETDRIKRWGTKSMLHAYILSAIRCDIKIPSPNINVDSKTEELFLDYCVRNRDRLKNAAKSSIPMDEFFKMYYDAKIPGNNVKGYRN